ncbi:hypothetical protein ACFODL_15425 [Phenylobacterium terrae]|uniref:Uncharacterized protein n=1 Tax=Phenylobacterium terrae TaxID=2665495 RepID=A0ABW4N727_9CAUL
MTKPITISPALLATSQVTGAHIVRGTIRAKIGFNPFFDELTHEGFIVFSLWNMPEAASEALTFCKSRGLPCNIDPDRGDHSLWTEPGFYQWRSWGKAMVVFAPEQHALAVEFKLRFGGEE